MNLILGSSSKWRKQILAKAGYEFTVMAPNIDEKAIRRDDPKELALAIAEAKTKALLPRIKKPAILITTDQIVGCNNKIYEKPVSVEDAREFMRSYAHFPASTLTAVVVSNTATGKRASGVDIATVHFHPIPEKAIEQLIQQGDIFSCAGGFQIEFDDGKIIPYVKHIEGSVDSVKGLPLRLLKELINNVGATLKIISGGQTGVDRVALDVALELNIPCGETCQLNCV